MENELKEIIELIEVHRKRAYRKINEGLVTMYFEIGKYLSNKISNEKWGNKTIETLSQRIKMHYPNITGFTRSGLSRMIKFYETYSDDVIVPSLLGQISWEL